MRVLAVRDDRIGDLILTLPALAELAAAGAEVTLAASSVNAELTAHDRRIARTVVLPGRGLARALAFARLVRRGHFDRVVFFRSRWPLGWVARLLGVRERVGALANVDGLAYTVRLRQHRSSSSTSEARYGLELVRGAGATTGIPPSVPRHVELAVPEAYRERARRWLSASVTGWRPGSPLVIVHPGSGGSSRNWRMEHYRALVRALARDGLAPTVVTGAPSEERLAREVASGAAPAAPVHLGWSGVLAHAALLAESRVVVSASTGTMHLAAAVGTATVSLFAPIRASSPSRWGALSPHARFLIPPVPDCERCIGVACPWWDCMDRIGVDRVMKEVGAALSRDLDSAGRGSSATWLAPVAVPDQRW